MHYDGNIVGPNLRRIRKKKKLTVDYVSEITGLSVSSIKQLEQGGRRLSMKSLYAFMTVYQCDANELLNIPVNESKNVLVLRLDRLPKNEKERCKNIFEQFIEMCEVCGGYRDEQ